MAHRNDKIPQVPGLRSDQPEDREPTEAELTALGASDLPPLTAPMDPSRDDDYESDIPARVANPTISDMQARMDAMLTKMEAQQQAGTGDSSGQLATAMLMIAEAMNGFRQATLDGANTVADVHRRGTSQENKWFPGISVFNLRGDKDYPRPTLKCAMFLPWPAEPESLTREELELLNLLEPGEYDVTLVDARKVRLSVTAEKHLNSDVVSKLTIAHPTAFNNEYHMLMPYNWIRQMAESRTNPVIRARAQAVLTMDDEADLIAARQYNDGRTAQGREQVVSVGA